MPSGPARDRPAGHSCPGGSGCGRSMRVSPGASASVPSRGALTFPGGSGWGRSIRVSPGSDREGAPGGSGCGRRARSPTGLVTAGFWTTGGAEIVLSLPGSGSPARAAVRESEKASANRMVLRLRRAVPMSSSPPFHGVSSPAGVNVPGRAHSRRRRSRSFAIRAAGTSKHRRDLPSDTANRRMLRRAPCRNLPARPVTSSPNLDTPCSTREWLSRRSCRRPRPILRQGSARSSGRRRG